MEPTISDELCGKAIVILKTVRISYKHGRYGPIEWESREQMDEAFRLYNRHNYRLMTGCMPCHVKVFNWLIDQAFRDVRVHELPNTTPEIHFDGPET